MRSTNDLWGSGGGGKGHANVHDRKSLYLTPATSAPKPPSPSNKCWTSSYQPLTYHWSRFLRPTRRRWTQTQRRRGDGAAGRGLVLIRSTKYQKNGPEKLYIWRRLSETEVGLFWFVNRYIEALSKKTQIGFGNSLMHSALYMCKLIIVYHRYH